MRKFDLQEEHSVGGRRVALMNSPWHSAYDMRLVVETGPEGMSVQEVDDEADCIYAAHVAFQKAVERIDVLVTVDGRAWEIVWERPAADQYTIIVDEAAANRHPRPQGRAGRLRHGLRPGRRPRRRAGHSSDPPGRHHGRWSACRLNGARTTRPGHRCPRRR